MPHPPRLLVAVLAVGAAASAQLVVPDDHATVQGAIDAAAPGEVIVVRDVPSTTLVIDKPLTLVGDPVFTVDASGFTCDAPGTSDGLNCPAITLDGPGAGDVVIVNAELTSAWFTDVSNGAYGTIWGGGFDMLQVLSSSVDGARTWGDEPGAGGAAIDVDVTHLVVADSTLAAGRSVFSQSFPFGPDGTPAVLGETVTLVDCVVQGGGFLDPFFFDCPSSCGDVIGGTGGAGVVADRLFVAATSVTPGEGLLVNCVSGVVVCQKPDGVDVSASQVVEFDTRLQGSGPIVAGQPWALEWRTLAEPSLLFSSIDPVTPTAVDAGWLFLDIDTLQVRSIPAGFGAASIVVDDPALIGVDLALQVYDPVAGLSSPVFTAFVP